MERSIAAGYGIRLNLTHWPAGEPARGTVLMVHGLGEHMGRYHAVAARLNAWGWHAVGHDQRGHGSSEGARAVLPSDDSLLEDLSLVIDKLKASLPTPLVLLGHSMGGLIAARFACGDSNDGWQRDVDALVLSSPALDPGMNTAQKALLALLGPLAPNLAVGNGLKPEWISRDAKVVAAYREDPQVHDRVTPRLVRFILEAGVRVRARASSWTVPTLLMWAGADRCVSPVGSRQFAQAAPNGVVQSQEFSLLFHEIFNEPEKDEVFALLGRWLTTRSADSG